MCLCIELYMKSIQMENSNEAVDDDISEIRRDVGDVSACSVLTWRLVLQ